MHAYHWYIQGRKKTNSKPRSHLTNGDGRLPRRIKPTPPRASVLAAHHHLRSDLPPAPIHSASPPAPPEISSRTRLLLLLQFRLVERGCPRSRSLLFFCLVVPRRPDSSNWAGLPQRREGNALGNAERCACVLKSYLVRELAG